MNKRIIYTLCMFDLFRDGGDCWQNRVITKFWEKTTIKSMNKYADLVGADFKVVCDMVDEIKNIPRLNYFMKVNLCKFYCIKHFYESDYEEMLLLDVDTYICPEARNIFLELDNSDMVLPVGGPPEHYEKLLESLIEVYKIYPRSDYAKVLDKYCRNDPPFFGGGLMLLNKKVAALFAEHFPFDLQAFLLDRGISEWPDYFTDESILNAFILLHDIEAQQLDWAFIGPPQADRKLDKTAQQLDENSMKHPLCKCKEPDIDFVHYWGHTKYKLFDLLEAHDEEE